MGGILFRMLFVRESYFTGDWVLFDLEAFCSGAYIFLTASHSNSPQTAFVTTLDTYD
jgi:hypothetical protein